MSERVTARPGRIRAGSGIAVTEDAGGVVVASTVSGVSDGDKGDITVSASGATWTIDDGVVTAAKMADIATDTFLGRDTAGTGVPEVLSVATAKTLLGLAGTNAGDVTLAGTPDYITISGQVITRGQVDLAADVTGTLPHGNLGTGGGGATKYLREDSTWQAIAGGGDVVGDDTSTTDQNIVAYNGTGGKNIEELTGTQGDVLYHNGTNWAKLGAGTSGDFLKTNGAGANPAWATAGGGTAASQAEQEAGSSTTVFTTPGRQHFHPSAAKFWVKATGGSTTIVVSYNMTSWANTGTGLATGTIATDFSSADWCGQVAVLDATSAWDATYTTGCGFGTMAATTFRVDCSRMQDGGTAAASLQNPASWLVCGFGDHA